MPRRVNEQASVYLCGVQELHSMVFSKMFVNIKRRSKSRAHIQKTQYGLQQQERTLVSLVLNSLKANFPERGFNRSKVKLFLINKENLMILAETSVNDYIITPINPLFRMNILIHV